MPESSEREKLSHMAREYAGGPGRPNRFDGFSKSEDSFAFANGKRALSETPVLSAIDQIIS